MIGKDAQGNYQAYLPAGQDYNGVRVGTLWHNEGAPSSSTGSNGDLYTNDSSGAVYRKINGTWGLVSAGGGGSGVIQVLSGTFSDPNGHATPDDTAQAALYYKESTTETVLWKWDGAAWYQLIG